MSDAPVGPGRHEARERALELLYEAEARGETAAAILDALPLAPDPFASAAFAGVEADRVAIDELLEAHSDDWPVHRLAPVDRGILRLAVWELRSRPDVPTAVVIDEAVELAKDYSTQRSPAFVNGVLDAIASVVRSG
ncbi:MAG: transcription antitermination factor NusB [Actinomycetota bacterium]